MTQKTGFLNYIHYFRGFAILIILGIHVRMVYPWGDHDIAHQLLISFLDNGTVLFVFIAGFLFQHLSGKFSYSNYLYKKLQYVVLPYLLVSIPAILNRLFIEPGTWEPDFLMDAGKIEKALYLITTGKHLGPFWFIPMIVLFYIISPLFIRIDRPWFYKSIFPLLMIGTLFTFRFGYFSNSIDSAIHFIPVYIFGIACSRYREYLTGAKQWMVAVLTGAYVLLFILEFTHILPVYRLDTAAEAASDLYFGFNSPKLRMMILCVLLIRFFYTIQHKDLPVLKLLGDYSFGLYFIHLYVIIAVDKVVRRYLWSEPTFNIVYYLIYLSIVTAVSLLIVWIVKRIFRNKSRLVIGS